MARVTGTRPRIVARALIAEKVFLLAKKAASNYLLPCAGGNQFSSYADHRATESLSIFPTFDSLIAVAIMEKEDRECSSYWASQASTSVRLLNESFRNRKFAARKQAPQSEGLSKGLTEKTCELVADRTGTGPSSIAIHTENRVDLSIEKKRRKIAIQQV